MLDSGNKIEDISVAMGNVSTKITEGYYARRVCRECGKMLRTYNDIADHRKHRPLHPDCPVMVFAGDWDRVLSAHLRYKTDLRDEGLNILDFVFMTPFAVSTLEIGHLDNDDLIMDGPFDEPDEKYIRRQRIAYGSSVIPVLLRL